MSEDAQVADNNDQKPEQPDEDAFGSSFDPKRAKALIENLRGDKAKLQARLADREELAKKWTAHEESQKTELQKLADRLATVEKEKAEHEARALRAEVAAAKGIPGDLVDLLTGSDKKELEAKADKLLNHLKDTKKLPDFATRRSTGKPITGRTSDADVDNFIRNFGR